MYVSLFISARTRRNPGKIERSGGLFLLLLLACGCYLQDGREAHQKELVCAFVDRAMKLDARLQEPEWRYASLLTLESRPPARSGTLLCRTLWNDDFLYLAFQEEYSLLRHKETVRSVSWPTAERKVRFCVDVCRRGDSTCAAGEKSCHIVLENPRPQTRSYSMVQVPSCRYAIAMGVLLLLPAKDNNTAWHSAFLIQLALPWGELGISPVPGRKIRVDFAQTDNGVFFNGVGDWEYPAPGAVINLVLKRTITEHS